MLVGSFRRLFKGDYPQEQQPLVEQLSVTINNGFEVLYNLATKKISLRDNVLCTVRDYEAQVDASGNPQGNTVVKLDNATARPDGIQVIKCDNLSNPNNYSGAVMVHFSPIEGAIQIVNIKGLTVGDKYRIRLVVYQN